MLTPDLVSATESTARVRLHALTTYILLCLDDLVTGDLGRTNTDDDYDYFSPCLSWTLPHCTPATLHQGYSYSIEYNAYAPPRTVWF